MFDVAIANLTLQKIGADDQIADPNEESHAGRTLRASWDLIRRIALRELTPTCAKRRAELAAREITTARPAIGWSNAFPLPADCLRLLDVLSPYSIRADYRLIGADDEAGNPTLGEILADTDGPVGIEYVKDLVEPARWDPLFAQSFADRLGCQIADRITCDLARVGRCQRDYDAARKAAGGADSKEQPPIAFEDSSWLTARFGGGGDGRVSNV